MLKMLKNLFLIVVGLFGLQSLFARQIQVNKPIDIKKEEIVNAIVSKIKQNAVKDCHSNCNPTCKSK